MSLFPWPLENQTKPSSLNEKQNHQNPLNEINKNSKYFEVF